MMHTLKVFYLMLLAFVLAVLLVPIAFIFQIFRSLYRGEPLSDLFWSTAIGLDQLGGSVLYKEPDWTVSSRTYWLSMQGAKNATRFMKIINFFFGKDHCKTSYIKEFSHVQNIQGKQGV